MTQVLINNLNTLPVKNMNSVQKSTKTVGMDFGHIFEIKTNKNENNAEDFKLKDDVVQKGLDKDLYKSSKEDTQQLENNNKSDNELLDAKIDDKTVTEADSLKENIEDDSNINKFAGMIFKFDTDDFTTAENLLTDVVKEIIAEDDEIIDLTEITGEINDSEENIITNEESDDTEETIITEEEPTMYNELITLEDPTALLMFQSQIQHAALTETQDELTESVSGKTNLNSTSQNLNNVNAKNNAEVFKQLDAQFIKPADIVKNSQAEITRSKSESPKLSNVFNENIVKELNVEVVSSQSTETESSMSDLMQNQSPQEQTTRIMIQGDVKYESVAAEASKQVSQVKTTNIAPSKIIDQISKQLESMFNNSKLNMVLNPGSLGKLNLQLINTKAGIIAQFTVTTQETMDILSKGLNGLKEALLSQGVNIDNVSVRLENTESEYESDYTEQEGSGGGNKHQGAKKQKEDGKNFEEMMFNLENEDSV